MEKGLINKLFDDKDIAEIFETYDEVICSDCNEKCDVASKIAHFFKDLENNSPTLFIFKLHLLKVAKSKSSASKSEQSEQSSINFDKVKEVVDSEYFSKMFSDNKELLTKIKEYINNKQNDNTSK
jgi:hypothetical protein